jgi:hypothetical protein
MRMTRFKSLWFFAVVVLLAVPLLSQTSARIEGSVQDQTGAVVAGAKISAVNIKTQAHSEVTSNAEGYYVIPSLQPGIYTVTIEAAGFQKEEIKNVELNVGATVPQRVVLRVGAVNESVVVEANAVSVQTTESQISSQVTLRDIDTLPQLGRTPITISVFQPGAQINPGDITFTHINGMRQGSNNSQLDGIDVNDSLVPRLGLSLTANNTDSINEFRVVTEGGKAEYGRNAGGQVDLITRSGTNKYHGGVFDYLRNTALNANDYFNNLAKTPRPQLIQNIYGGSFGGPIIHDKTFIFGNFQGRRTHQATVRNRTVLTPLARQGIFQWIDGGGVLRSFNIATADPRGIGVDPQMAKLFALVPAPNNSSRGDGLNTAGFLFNNPTPSFEDQFTIRGDHKVRSNLSAFLRWSWQRNSSIDSLNNADATYPGQLQGTQGGHRWGFAAGADWDITPNFINEFRIGHQSAGVVFARPARLKGPTIITNLFNPDPINSAYAQGRNSPVNDITDNMTKVWKNHTFKWGTNIRFTLQTGFNDAGIYQNVTTAVANGNTPPAALVPAGLTNAQKSTFQQLYNDVLGRMDQVAETFFSRDLQSFQAPGTTRQRDYTLHESGYYFQDDWRIRRNLTLNLGLRYELFGRPNEENGIQATVQGADQINGINQLTNITVARGNAWYKQDWNNFAPRAGFAWDIFGDSKTSLRGNYGIFYDRNVGAVVNSADGNTPGFSQAVSVFPNSAPGSDVRVSDGIPLPVSPAAPVLTLPVAGRTANLTLFNPNLRTGYVQSYSLNIQRELTRNTVLEVGYVGNRGIKLFMNQDLNQLKIDGDFLNAFTEMQAFVANGTAPSPGNTLVKMFGTPAKVVTNLGSTNFTLGNVGTVANAVDRSFNNLYAAAGLPQTYLRNYPQFNQVIVGGNAGRSYYDALQIGVHRSTGALRVSGNYTFSKSIDNISAEGNGFTTPVDNYNTALNRALGDFDHRHSFNGSAIYSLPFGKGRPFASNLPRWVDTLVGGWDVGSLFIMQDGPVFSVFSQRTSRGLLSATSTNSTTGTFANYTSDRNGNVVHNPDGTVSFFTPAQIANFTPPAAGAFGTGGRNGFRGPAFYNVDASLVKRFKITEGQAFTFRAEAYNLFNHPNFGTTGGGLDLNINDINQSNISASAFGKFSQTLGAQNNSSARTMQVALRYDF